MKTKRKEVITLATLKVDFYLSNKMGKWNKRKKIWNPR